MPELAAALFGAAVFVLVLLSDAPPVQLPKAPRMPGLRARPRRALRNA